MPAEKKEETGDKKEELVVVGDGADETPQESVDQQLKTEKKAEVAEETTETDERVGHEEESETDDNVEGETQEQKRTRRRAERQAKREKDARLRREVNFLRKRNDDVEKKLTQMARRQDEQENTHIDTRVSSLDAQIRQAEKIHAEAIKANDGDTATEALKIKDELVETKRRVTAGKRAPAKEETESKTETRTTDAPTIDPEIVTQATEWARRNQGWFDPTLNDETSHLAKVMEDRLSREGKYDPSDPEYWRELDRRIQARFPDIKKKAMSKTDVDWNDNDGDDDDDEGGEERGRRPAPNGKKSPEPKKKSGGPRFSVGGRERPLGKNEVYISAERRKALEDAGLWEDKTTRERYLKSYQSYDQDAHNK